MKIQPNFSESYFSFWWKQKRISTSITVFYLMKSIPRKLI
jgi:hypothetical protein